MIHFRNVMPILAALAGLSLADLSASNAHAGLLPTSVVVTPEGSFFRWTYQIDIPSGTQVKPDDYFTIYDFKGLVPGSITNPEGWSFTPQALGPTPPFTTPQDDGAITNLGFKFVGATPIYGGATVNGIFTALSTFNEVREVYFTSQTHRIIDGLPESSVTSTSVPEPTNNNGGGDPGVPDAPEPTTVALLGLSLPLLGVLRLLRRRKSAGN